MNVRQQRGQTIAETMPLSKLGAEWIVLSVRKGRRKSLPGLTYAAGIDWLQRGGGGAGMEPIFPAAICRGPSDSNVGWKSALAQQCHNPKARPFRFGFCTAPNTARGQLPHPHEPDNA